MNLPFLIYIANIADNLWITLFIIALLVGILFIIIIVANYDISIEKQPFLTSTNKRLLIISLILWSLLALMPTSKTIYMMLGVTYSQELSVPTNFLNIINQKLETYTKEENK